MIRRWRVLICDLNGMEIGRSKHMFKFMAEYDADRLRMMALIGQPFTSGTPLYAVTVERNERWPRR